MGSFKPRVHYKLNPYVNPVSITFSEICHLILDYCWLSGFGDRVLCRHYIGILYEAIVPIVENQMEKQMENYMETGSIFGLL